MGDSKVVRGTWVLEVVGVSGWGGGAVIETRVRGQLKRQVRHS